MIYYFFKILRIECCHTENWKNGGGPAAAAENRRLPPNFFLPFLAELDNSESYETNFFFVEKIPLVFAFDTCSFSKNIQKKSVKCKN